MVRRVVVLGGTGFIGRAFARRCIAHGADLRLTVVTRSLPRGAPLRPLPGLDLVQADVHDPAALARVVAGADVVVNLIAILHGSAADFERVHVELARRLAQACRDGGVGHIVHVSALALGVDAPSLYLRSKAAGEAALRGARLPLTVLRPSVVFGAEDRLLNLLARLQSWSPVLPLAAAGSRMQPVWVRDVAQALWACIDREGNGAGVYEAAGPQVITLAELARIAGRRTGHARPVIALPAALARAQAWLLEHAPGPTLMSRDNLRSLQVDNVATGTFPGLQALDIEPASIEQAWAQERGDDGEQASLLRWRAARVDR
ncbi:MAG: complex I NDUFA9 subunit family protein [Ideonella sp.]|nr:complex I NDUFA9 subunit family protein [Ideonella sp.]MCC7457446.1 complex I NDUFA9 subunit family protein [Nitrospira sp.]